MLFLALSSQSRHIEYMLGTTKEHDVFVALWVGMNIEWYICLYAFRISNTWKSSEFEKNMMSGAEEYLDFTIKGSHVLNINSQKKSIEFWVLRNTLTSEVGFPSWWCSSFDLWYRSITDFMLVKEFKLYQRCTLCCLSHILQKKVTTCFQESPCGEHVL